MTNYQITSFSDSLGDVAHERHMRAGGSQSFHMDFLDDIGHGILPTDLIVLGASTGAGKTTLANHMAFAAVKNGKRALYLALEAHRGEIQQRLIYREMAKIAWETKVGGYGEISYGRWCNGGCEWLTDEVQEKAIENLKEYAGLHILYRERDMTVADVATIIRERGPLYDILVLDHLHFIDNDDYDENRGMKGIVKGISDAITDAEVPVICVAHLRKKDRNVHNRTRLPFLDDFHGSSDITKIATKAIVMGPACPPANGKCPTFIQVAKDRLEGSRGIVGLCMYNLDSCRYDKGYWLGTMSGNKFNLITKDYPWWARNVNRGELPIAQELITG